MSVTAPLLHAVVWEEGCPPTACVHVCVCHTLLHPPTLHLVRVGAHICVLIFLETHGCPLPLSSSLHLFHHHIMWRRGRAAMHSRRVGRQWDDHHQPRSALACHVLLDADAKHTQCHTSPTSHPPPLFHSIYLPSLPHDASHRSTTTKKVSQPPCSRASTHAIAAMADGVVWWVWGKGATREERREEKRKHNISRTHTCTTCCLCLQVLHAGGGGYGLVVVARNASSGAATAAAAVFPLCTGTCNG